MCIVIVCCPVCDIINFEINLSKPPKPLISYMIKKARPYTARKVSKYGVFSGPYFPVFGLNTGKYGPENTPYLDTLHVNLNISGTKRAFNIK